MAENEQQSLIAQIENQRALDRLKTDSVESARQELPKLKTQIASFLRQHEDFYDHEGLSSQSEDDLIPRRRIRGRFDSGLSVSVPSLEGDVNVRISSTGFPRENEDNNRNIDYQIRVDGLDHFFETSQDMAVILSTQRTVNIRRRGGSPVIGGGPVAARPSWIRVANKEDISKYRNLINTIASDPNVRSLPLPLNKSI